MEKISAACAMEWSIKLDKSLRSKNPAKAVESILEIGEKLEQWSKEPESTIAVYNILGLIPEEDKLFFNTILSRLVEAFCSGDKLVMLAVVRVFKSIFKLNQQKNRNECATWFLSKAKVDNHVEILMRVKKVYDKGDTEARALALILFGCWREFSSEFAPVRFLIFTSMVSSHDLEVRSSLFAAACFCEVADDFALVVLGMLSDMVKSPGLMPKTRLAAVRVFAKMGCSHAIANRAFKIGMKLMMDCSGEDSFVPYLVSLTKLASSSTHLASELAEVIMPFLGENKTLRVRAAVLRCLYFLIKKGMCFSLVSGSEITFFSSLLKQAELSPNTQVKALQVFQKTLIYKLCVADKSELHQLIDIVDNASHSPIFSNSSLAIRILVNIWQEIVQIAETRSVEISSNSLPLQLVKLIMDRITLCSDPSQVDCTVVNEVQDLFSLLHQLVRKHSEMTMTALEKVSILLEYIINLTDGGQAPALGIINYKRKRGTVARSEFIASIHNFLIVFLENIEGAGLLSSQIYEKVKHITEIVSSCSFFDYHTQMIYSLLVHSPVLWGLPKNQIETTIDADENSGFPLVADIFNFGVVSLECSKQILMEQDYWPAYRAGVCAACLGAWVTSALIFGQLKANVQSEIYSFWLKSLTYLSLAEAKFQLLLTPGDSFKLVNWLKTGDYLPELTKDASMEFALNEAYMNLQSSLGMLGNTIASSELVFCFQTWFLVLKSQLLEILLDLVKPMDLLKKQSGEILIGCNSLKQLPKISVQLHKLANKFDFLATCFIDIDDRSCSIIAALALSCSVLAFAAGIVHYFPVLLIPCSSLSNVSSMLVQDLVGRLWKVDSELCEKLNLLVDLNKSLNCLHLKPKNQPLQDCGKVKMLVFICREALSSVHGLQKGLDSIPEEEIMSEVTKICRNLLSQAITKWMQIPFGIPKYFFNTRPCVGSELLASSSHSNNTISVEQGFDLSLDLCLQMKNVQPQVSRRISKLYCLLCSKLAYQNLTRHGENNRYQKFSLPWKDEELIEMSNKLYRHVLKSGKSGVSGQVDWNKSGGSGVSAVVEFEPDEKGQGFSSCLLDVSRFPVGSYQIKWLSSCVDSHGSYWNLLPLNSRPVFKVKKASLTRI